MIASLNGTVLHATSHSLVLDVNGVGYLIHVTPNVASGAHIGSALLLHTSLTVREDALTLFGFETLAARDFFELLQSVSGIGPKVALSALSFYRPTELADAITREDSAAIEKVPGLGKKGAQRLILELKEKAAILGLSQSSDGAKPSPRSPWKEQLLSALVGLGFTAKDAQSRIDSVALEVSESEVTDISELLKLALASGKQP